jgi:hypothetical protein
MITRPWNEVTYVASFAVRVTVRHSVVAHVVSSIGIDV